MPAIFELQVTSSPNEPKWVWTPRGQRYFSPGWYSAKVQNSSPFHSTTNHFGLTGYFRASAPSDSIMTLSSTRSNYHKCPLLVLSIQNFATCSSTPASLELQVILRHVCRTERSHNMTLNTARSKAAHIYYTSNPETKSLSVCYMTSCFQPFCGNCTKWPRNDLHITRSKEPRICGAFVVESQISVGFALPPGVLEVPVILTQSSATNSRKKYKVKGTPCMSY